MSKIYLINFYNFIIIIKKNIDKFIGFMNSLDFYNDNLAIIKIEADHKKVNLFRASKLSKKTLLS